MSEIEVNLEEKKLRQHQRFASDSVSAKVNTNYKAKSYDINRIQTALEDPIKNYKILQEVSEYIYNLNGTYQRLLKDIAFMPEYDCILTPKVLKMNKNTKQRTYFEAALLIDKINPKSTFKRLGQKLLKYGELYIYEIEDTDSIMYKEMPVDMCMVTSIENGICKYSINLDVLKNKDILATMPKDIQKIYEKYAKGSIKKELLLENKWYELEKNAYAFNFIDPFLPKGYPPLSYLFKGLTALDKMTNKLLLDEEVEALKIVHNYFPLDENGDPTLEPELARLYHESVKANLPENVTIATTPLKMEVHSFQGNNKQTNYRQEALDNVYQSAGVSKEKFSGERNSNQAIAISTQSDEMIALELVRIFEPYLNYKLRQNKKTSGWKVKILENTYYNKSDFFREAKEAASSGGSRFVFMGSCHLSPLETLTIRQAEIDMDMDDLLTPLMNGQNTSSKLIEDKKNGRPSAKDNGEIAEGEGE